MKTLTLNHTQTTLNPAIEGERVKAYKNKTSDKQTRKSAKAFRDMRKNKRNMWLEA